MSYKISILFQSVWRLRYDTEDNVEFLSLFYHILQKRIYKYKKLKKIKFHKVSIQFFTVPKNKLLSALKEKLRGQKRESYVGGLLFFLNWIAQYISMRRKKISEKHFGTIEEQEFVSFVLLLPSSSRWIEMIAEKVTV